MAATRANLETFNVGDTFLTKYQIRGLIGRGGQAAVYHSYDTYIDRDVAIKVMTDTSETKREHSRRAQMEARVLCKVHHPNIVHVYDAGTTENGLIYIIMELLRGRTLRDVLRHLHKLTVYEVLWLGAQIADGVEMAHQQHVIHRDLKPENVFVVDGNAVKVLDFGIAKFLTLTGITTQRDTLQGTMWYISPEHVQGLGVTARSDIYALGSILYEAISGTPPCLMGLQEITTQSVVWSQISRMPPQLNELMPTVPSHVGRLVHRMLLKEPGKRHGSMAEVAELLRAACRRIKTENGISATALRELWHDGKEEAQEALPRELGVADISKDPGAPNVMQPTVEVRDSIHEVAVDVKRDPALVATVPIESGLVAPSLPPGVEQAAKSASPYDVLDQPTWSQTEMRPEHDAVVSAPAPIAAVPGADALAMPPKALLSRRRQLVATAVALGTVFGIVLGFCNGHLLNPTKNQSAVAPPSVKVSVVPPAQPDPLVTRASPSASQTAAEVTASALPATASDLRAVAPQPTASAVSEPSPSVAITRIKPLNSTPNKDTSASTAQISRTSITATAPDKDALKKPPRLGLKPPYKSEDLD